MFSYTVVAKWAVRCDANNKEGKGTNSKPPRKFPVPPDYCSASLVSFWAAEQGKIWKGRFGSASMAICTGSARSHLSSFMPLPGTVL